MKYIKIFFLALTLVSISLTSCTEDDEPCTERVCPDGLNNCFGKPCDF